jgi:hypothetical protein
MPELLIVFSVLLFIVVAWLALRVAALTRDVASLPAGLEIGLEQKNREMLKAGNDFLNPYGGDVELRHIGR